MTISSRPQFRSQTPIVDKDGKLNQTGEILLTRIIDQLPAHNQQPFNGIGDQTTLTANVMNITNSVVQNLVATNASITNSNVTNLTTNTITANNSTIGIITANYAAVLNSNITTLNSSTVYSQTFFGNLVGNFSGAATFSNETVTNVLTANVLTANTINTFGNVSANYFTGNGALLTGIAASTPVATYTTAGIVRPDGTTITITGNVISSVGGVGGNTSIINNFLSTMDGEDGNDWHIPGPQGTPGTNGTPGIQGPVGAAVFGIDGEDGNDWNIPGPQGIQGLTGPQGAVAIGMMWDGIDGEDGVPRLGATGNTGLQGQAGVTIPTFDGEDGQDGFISGMGGSGNFASLTVSGLYNNPSLGDQFVIASDSSPFRMGSYIGTSGTIYTLAGNNQIMWYGSHNTALTSAGSFLGTGATGTSMIWTFQENDLMNIYTAPSVTAGTVPTFKAKPSYSFNTATGSLAITGALTAQNIQGTPIPEFYDSSNDSDENLALSYIPSTPLTKGYGTSSPTTGTTITCAVNTVGYLLTPAGTLATLTFKMPPSPVDGMTFWVATSQTITAITWQDSAGTAANVIGGVASLTTAGQQFIYNLSGTKWYSI